MAQKKSGKKKSGTPEKYRASKSGKASGTQKKTAEKKAPSSFVFFAVPVILTVLAVVTAIALFSRENAGAAGGAFGSALLGLFSVSAYLIPVYMLAFAIFFRRLAEENVLGRRVALCIAVHFILSMLCHVFFGGAHSFDIRLHYENGIALRGGGAVGSMPGELLWRGLNICMPIILIGALIILIPLLFGITPRSIWTYLAYKIKLAHRKNLDMREERALRAAEERERAEKEAGIVAYGKGEQLPLTEQTADTSPAKKKAKPLDTDLDPETALDERIFVDPAEFDEAMKKIETLPGTKNIEIYDESDKPDGNALPDADAAGESGEADEAYTSSEKAPEVTQSETEEDETLDLSAIFAETEDEALTRRLREMYGEAGGEDIELEVERRRVTPIPFENADIPDNSPDDGDESDTQPEPEEEAYRFPPVELLCEDPGRHDPNIAREMEANAKKLTDALREFSVNATIVNKCHGPTITRYELTLQAGTRISKVSNLSDDISLSLAASGSIRIEAPIPGKSAVGIEVPNKERETVYLRTLIENDAFQKDSRLWVALGAGVAGEGVYFDISKMPHLLIAGATGMGKSVCINCLIVSLLYRADPDEVKLILIDPKRVEFKPYEGLPHLLVPVVSDPKKAAGSLSWAVNEMERRFSLIEEAGVRDISGYNKVAARDPSKEKLPHIVIIIDELADLMMTAKDAVESSICRIAQKARAAGMHLIIGTQRPSVDVITGLIKSNIPSRIACTVASQIDSRTIIDRSGAEKLLGKGDMLFNPVGAQKPLRVQGAFVSDEEVEAVVEFIKSQGHEATANSEEIVAEIEREAARCDSGKKGASALAQPGDEGDEDPMLRSALELAVESGKISTSLIQRRLSLGYGRAAKLIDRMERLGYVSAPDGQKPREVLISKEQFMEMVLRDEEV